MRLMLMVIIGVAILVFATIAIILKRKHDLQTNYRALFIVGITWMPLGIIMQNYLFALVGVLFFAVGLANRKKWDDQPRWNELSPPVRKLKMAMMIFLGLLLLVGLAAYFLTKRGVL